MFCDWNSLPEYLQLTLSREAMGRAAAIVAEQAEQLAEEIDCGNLADRGGADALRLLAAMVRVSGEDELIPAGHA